MKHPRNDIPKIVIDTDMGHDDVMAIALLLAAQLPIAGITTVNGLCHVAQGTDNLLRLLGRSGRGEIPVAVGADKPLVGEHSFKIQWREKVDRLAAVNLPPSDLNPVRLSAFHWITEIVNQYPQQIILLCLGPLTNIALALQLGGKAFVRGVKRIVLMGGAIHVPGNGTPNEVSEWNIYVDPLAAAQTIRSGIPITMVGLDVTNQAPCIREFVDNLCEKPAQNPCGLVMQEVLKGMSNYVYDAVAAAYLVDSSVIRTVPTPVTVLLDEKYAGQTIIDPNGSLIDVGVELDQHYFNQMLLQLIHKSSSQD